jgi:hypothetical protein
MSKLGLVGIWISSSLASLSLLLPLWQARRRWDILSEAQKVFTGYLLAELLIAVGCFVLGRLRYNNLWITHLMVPVETALIVLAFSYWQVDRRMGLALRRGAPLMLLFWLPSIIGWEPVNDFSIGTDSLQAIICVAVAAYTVVRLSFESSRPSVEHEWFWIGGGVMLYFATYALISPLEGYLVKHSYALALAVLTVRGGFQVIANLLYFLGMRCPPSRQHSGPSTSPPRAWSLFSWSRSGGP